MVQIPLTADSEITTFGRDLGTGTAFPATGPASSALRRGDAFYHSTYGALFLWNGTAWRARGPGELTSAQRVALVTANIPYAGFQVFETDTGRTFTYAAGSWQLTAGQKPTCIIYDNASPHGATTGGVWTEIGLAGELTDTDNMHAAGVARVVVPFDGYYMVRGQVSWVSGAAGATTKAVAIGATPGARDGLGSTIMPGGIPTMLGTATVAHYSNGGVALCVPTVPRRLWLTTGQWVSLWGYATGISTLQGSLADPGQTTFLEVVYDGA